LPRGFEQSFMVDRVKRQAKPGVTAAVSLVAFLLLIREVSALRRAIDCQEPTNAYTMSLSRELSQIHPDFTVTFAVPYREGKNQIREESVEQVWLFQTLREAGWDVDWFQTEVDLNIRGFAIVVNDSSAIPPDSLELAQILAKHSVKFTWIEDPRIVSLTNDWCIYIGC
jgi:hypothetical protein